MKVTDSLIHSTLKEIRATKGRLKLIEEAKIKLKGANYENADELLTQLNELQHLVLKHLKFEKKFLYIGVALAFFLTGAGILNGVIALDSFKRGDITSSIISTSCACVFLYLGKREIFKSEE